MAELRRNEVLVFCDGTLTIKQDGAQIGWATLSIPEDQIEYEDGHASVEIAPSELRELHDFIGRVLNIQKRAT